MQQMVKRLCVRALMCVYRCANSSWWGPFAKARLHAASQTSRRQERGEVKGE
jgi:hypothetical protein